MTPPAKPARATEILRVGVPIGARKLVALLELLDVSESVTVRHHAGHLLIEEPAPSLATGDGSGTALPPIAPDGDGIVRKPALVGREK